MPWAFQLKPHVNELLSGYLCRVALAHGATPFGFYNLHLGDSAFWARDIDRGVALHKESSLIDRSGLSQESIRGLTLASWIRSLTPSTYRGTGVPAIVPWINAAGVFHRTRRLHSLQFCPACLRHTTAIDKCWRLSFMLVCPIHHSPLLDGCWACDAPFMPHLARRRANRCHHCQADLSVTPAPRAKFLASNERILDLQSHLYLLLTEQTAFFYEVPVDLRSLRELMSALLVGKRATLSMAMFGVEKSASANGRFRLETARLAERVPALLLCSKMLSDWPHSFRFLTQRLRLSRRAFESLREPSEWLATEVLRLPAGLTYAPRSAELRLDHRLANLARECPANWRSTRAELILRAARKHT
jgi:hypothetical protein